jgi:hypothetical protein
VQHASLHSVGQWDCAGSLAAAAVLGLENLCRASA